MVHPKKNAPNTSVSDTSVEGEGLLQVFERSFVFLLEVKPKVMVKVLFFGYSGWLFGVVLGFGLHIFCGLELSCVLHMQEATSELDTSTGSQLRLRRLCTELTFSVSLENRLVFYSLFPPVQVGF